MRGDAPSVTRARSAAALAAPLGADGPSESPLFVRPQLFHSSTHRRARNPDADRPAPSHLLPVSPFPARGRCGGERGGGERGASVETTGAGGGPPLRSQGVETTRTNAERAGRGNNGGGGLICFLVGRRTGGARRGRLRPRLRPRSVEATGTDGGRRARAGVTTVVSILGAWRGRGASGRDRDKGVITLVCVLAASRDGGANGKSIRKTYSPPTRSTRPSRVRLDSTHRRCARNALQAAHPETPAHPPSLRVRMPHDPAIQAKVPGSAPICTNVQGQISASIRSRGELDAVAVTVKQRGNTYHQSSSRHGLHAQPPATVESAAPPAPQPDHAKSRAPSASSPRHGRRTSCLHPDPSRCRRTKPLPMSKSAPATATSMLQTACFWRSSRRATPDLSTCNIIIHDLANDSLPVHVLTRCLLRKTAYASSDIQDWAGAGEDAGMNSLVAGVIEELGLDRDSCVFSADVVTKIDRTK
ncbi:hypothetical protein B0H17DRAFT_1214703 [Mycena rosella]|uniref:Uncharacterized protein n=1 Tax=Mycena rosella TaxID=1033263 RepID=A0AAD7CMA8_MYCRO|nr:hypothetical protein B0H17DRAFT_1214703 [Mycena rosella]